MKAFFTKILGVLVYVCSWVCRLHAMFGAKSKKQNKEVDSNVKTKQQTKQDSYE